MGIRVRATMKGYYGFVIREKGAEFTIENEEAFSKKWMERVETKPAAKAEEPKEAKATGKARAADQSKI